MLIRIFGPKREEVVGGWRRLLSEELCNMYISPNIRAIKPWEDEMGRTHSTYGRDEKSVQNFLVETLKGRGHAEDLGIDGKVILDWMFGK